uniref:Ferredoxin fas2 n=2 Tax=Rhodococcoides fascians TaxID=1828 RepID=FAS2_RHOFA|nr:RecName: Full=Ferredoxin fas2 [Rhodococcus fascians]AET25214.1 putative dual protein [Rhodococcus fascians D188]CAA82742.1 ferredoxine [Rhodococcus fascians D188]
MKVVVNERRCFGSGQCVLVAPEVFEQSNDGTVTLLVDKPSPDNHSLVRAAARSCPATAIRFEENAMRQEPTEFSYDDLPALISRMRGDERHSFSSSSTMDVLWVLYDEIPNVSPESPDDDDRDRFLLSKGHGPMAYYAVLAAKGFLRPELLDTWATKNSPLGFAPDRTKISGVEMSGGSLGHGLPLAVGVAMGLRIQNRHAPRVFVLIGDGEFDEGSNHEAMAFAGRARLNQLTVIVLDNGTASMGWPHGIDKRFDGEGWDTININGADHEEIAAALNRDHNDRPLAVVATVTRQSARSSIQQR